MESNISWTEKTWNPITGCTQFSEACKNCYAKKIASSFQISGMNGYEKGFEVTTHDYRLNKPAKWYGSWLIFVCSMSDIFHEDVPFEFVDKIMNVITNIAPRHTYQLLTKRAERMAEYFSTRPVPKNVWLGVTVENKRAKYRIDILRNIDSPLRFLSCEPLLEDLGTLDLTDIHWVIVGGEKVDEDIRKARPMSGWWALSIEEQATLQGALFHFKQWGNYGRDGVLRRAKDNGSLWKRRICQPIPYVNRHTLFG